MLSNLSVDQEILLPMLSKHFENISPAQWRILSQGHFDSRAGTTLAEMCTEMSQKLCSDASKFIMPMFLQRIGDTNANRLAPVPQSTTKSALKIPLIQCDNATKLDSLLADEFSKRLNSTLNAEQLTSLTHLPATSTNLNGLYQMARLSGSALLTYLDHVEARKGGFGACWRQPSVQKGHGDQLTQIEEVLNLTSSCALKSNMSLDDTTEAVIEMLHKCLASKDMEPVSSQPEIPPTICGDVHNPSEMDSSNSKSSVRFDQRWIQKTVMRFFSSRIEESARKKRFVEFSRRRFRKMMADVVSPDLWKDSEYLVTFQGSTDSAFDPKLSRPGSDVAPLNFEVIQDDVEDLYNCFAKAAKKATKLHENLNEEMTKFSKKLRYKIFNHVKVNEKFCPSEFVNKQKPGQRKQKKHHLDVLYNFVEDSIGMFLQQILLWMELESRKDITNAPCATSNVIDMFKSSIDNQGQDKSCLHHGTRPKQGASVSADHQNIIQSNAGSVAITTTLREKLAMSLVNMLIMTLVKEFPKKVRKSMEQHEVQSIISKVYREVLKGTDLDSLISMDMVLYNKFIKMVIKGLFHQYQSKKKLLETFMSNSDLFRDAVLKHITYNLKCNKVDSGRTKI